MHVPDRRTLIVLGALIGAMTLAGGVLLALEPRPATPAGSVLLSSVDKTVAPEKALFDTNPGIARGRWQAIVIHQSGYGSGSADSLGRAHEKAGLGGLGYHFVIGNGDGMPDGQIEASFRWSRQMVGAYASGRNSDAFNKQAIGICLIGDGNRKAPSSAQLRELVWLVRRLQQQCGIPADRVVLQGPHTGTPPAKLFPVALLREQLLGNPR
jgi:hypothetical protein